MAGFWQPREIGAVVRGEAHLCLPARGINWENAPKSAISKGEWPVFPDFRQVQKSAHGPHRRRGNTENPMTARRINWENAPKSTISKGDWPVFWSPGRSKSCPSTNTSAPFGVLFSARNRQFLRRFGPFLLWPGWRPLMAGGQSGLPIDTLVEW